MAIGRDRNSIVPAVPYHFVCCSILLHFTFVHSPIPSHHSFFILYLPFERHLWPSVGTAIPLRPLFHTIVSALPHHCIFPPSLHITSYSPQTPQFRHHMCATRQNT